MSAVGTQAAVDPVHSFIVGELLNEVEVWVIEVPEPHLCSDGAPKCLAAIAANGMIYASTYLRRLIGLDITVGRIVRDAHDI